MSVRNRQRRQAERNLANQEMWRAKFNAAMDKFDKNFRGTENMLVVRESGLPYFATGSGLIHKGRKP